MDSYYLWVVGSSALARTVSRTALRLRYPVRLFMGATAQKVAVSSAKKVSPSVARYNRILDQIQATAHCSRQTAAEIFNTPAYFTYRSAVKQRWSEF